MNRAPNDERAAGGDVSQRKTRRQVTEKRNIDSRQYRRTEKILQAAEDGFRAYNKKMRVYSVYMSGIRRSFSLALLPSTTGGEKKKKMLLKHEAATSDRPLTSPLHDTRDQMRQQQFKLHHWNHKYRHPSCQNQDSMLVEILEKAVLLSSIKYQYDLLVEGKWVHLFSCWKVSANASVSACFRLFSLASPFKH